MWYLYLISISVLATLIFQSFNEYFSAEHSRLLSLWRAVVSFRRQWGERKTATERDMSHLRSDITRASRSMHSACLNLSANMRNSDTQAQVTVTVFCRTSFFLHSVFGVSQGVKQDLLPSCRLLLIWIYFRGSTQLSSFTSRENDDKYHNLYSVRQTCLWT